MRVMIHKIHRGPNLPSVKAGTPYEIIGNAQIDPRLSPTVAFPQDIRNCQNCHEGRNPAQKPSQSDVWYTKPARAACGACHDDINWVTGENHPGGPQADDSACASCHVPQGDRSTTPAIKDAHTPPYRSKQLKGLNATILAVDNVGPGKKPVVTFKLTENDGTVLDPKTFGASSSLNILLGGPTTDYGTGQTPPAQPFRESADGATFNGSVATYTFTNAIPANATGTWAVAIEARRTITFNPAPREGPATYTEGAVNPSSTSPSPTAQPVPRRSVVVDSWTSATRATTGSPRPSPRRPAHRDRGVRHLPQPERGRLGTAARRTKNPPESIAFKRMIHRIHIGRGADSGVHGLRFRRHSDQLQRGPLPG